MHWFYGIKFCKQFNFYRRNVSWNVLDRSDCNLAYFLPIHAPLALDFIITSRCSCQNFSGSYFASTTDIADFLYNCVCVGFLDELFRFKSWFQLHKFWNYHRSYHAQRMSTFFSNGLVAREVHTKIHHPEQCAHSRRILNALHISAFLRFTSQATQVSMPLTEPITFCRLGYICFCLVWTVRFYIHTKKVPVEKARPATNTSPQKYQALIADDEKNRSITSFTVTINRDFNTWERVSRLTGMMVFCWEFSTTLTKVTRY